MAHHENHVVLLELLIYYQATTLVMTLVFIFNAITLNSHRICILIRIIVIWNRHIFQTNK